MALETYINCLQGNFDDKCFTTLLVNMVPAIYKVVKTKVK